jgi:hypothetical protein
MNKATTAGVWMAGLVSLLAAEGPTVKPLYQNDFQQATVDQVPEGLMVLEGAFAVKADGTNKFLELPGAPVDDFSLLFGPLESAGVAVEARIHGTSKGRRYPVLAVGLNGVGGFKMPVAPAKKALELFKGDDRLASVPFTWESDTWTILRLQVRKTAEGVWKVEGKAWKQGTTEPAGWMITHEEKEEPHAGRAMISGQPFAGTPIRFDDLHVLPAVQP